MTAETDILLKRARNCHSKQAWRDLFASLKGAPGNALSSKQLHELFKLLSGDPQCLQYGVDIWSFLLSGCLLHWDLDLGVQIAAYSSSIPSSQIAIPAATIHMENGAPAAARKLASRALRLANLESWEELQLQMIVCNSYVEEGKNTMALRLLKKMELAIGISHLDPVNLADLLVNMARAQFFLGRYPEAARIFYKANEIYFKLENWEAAAKAIFNAAACYHNSGNLHQKQAFELIEQCKNLCTKNKLFGPLSHCHAFYGTDDYQKGNFLTASKHYKKALDYAPVSDKSFRRLHITSMLAFTYLKLGHYQLAEKIGAQTLKMASFDDSERFRCRYQHLNALLKWQQGDMETSRNIIREAVKPLFSQGINTLEELSMTSCFFLQAAALNEKETSTKVKIAEQLKDDTASWFEYLYALSQLLLTKGKYAEAMRIAKECRKRSTLCNSKYVLAGSILTIIQIYLAQSIVDDELLGHVDEFQKILENIEDSSLRVHHELIQASLAYRRGDFSLAIKHISSANKLKRLDHTDQLIVQSWLATAHGHSPKLNSLKQVAILARSTRIYFSPSIEHLTDTTFLVSKLYTVELGRHPLLASLLCFLLAQNDFCSSPAELQKEVWHQSLHSQGWQQKVRNTIMRLREFFPYTMAPLILQLDNRVGLFQEAITISDSKSGALQYEELLLNLLQETPQSSSQLSKQAKISPATAKRIIKKLMDQKAISMSKEGRNVVYKIDVGKQDCNSSMST